MRKTLFILLFTFLSINSFCQENKEFDFEEFRTIGNEFVIDLTNQDNIIHKSDNKTTTLVEKDKMHLGFFVFDLDKQVNLNSDTFKLVDYSDFIKKLKQTIIEKNTYLKSKRIKKAVSLDNLVYLPVFVKIKQKENLVYYKSLISYKVYLF
ncbi:MAG: hypothetical protein LBI73_14810 [Myroides sp.]|jgi:hypothetical protein|nr:hypothetical protein [Myroides sp.]